MAIGVKRSEEEQKAYELRIKKAQYLRRQAAMKAAAAKAAVGVSPLGKKKMAQKAQVAKSAGFSVKRKS